MAAKAKVTMVLQFDGRDYDLLQVETQVRKAWKDDGRKVSDIQSVDIYVKPQEAKAYYVVNKEVEGSVSLA